MARMLALALTSTMLGSAPSAGAQDAPPARTPIVEEVPTRVTPPPKAAPDTKRDARVRVVRAQSATPIRPGVPLPTQPQRVDVLHLYDTPENIHLRSDLRTFYLPHGIYATVPTDSAAWALEAAHLARHPYDRRQLLDLYRYRAARERRAGAQTRQEQALRSGLTELKRGDLVRAIAALSLAAELDQGDPASRLHLAQARLQRGHFEEAAAALRRALELQPKLVFLDLELDRYYARPGTLRAGTQRLAQWLRSNRATADAYFLLGYLSYQLGEYEDAHSAFQRVRSVRPRDELTLRYLSVTRP